MKIALQVKGLAAKSDDPNLIPGPTWWEEEQTPANCPQTCLCARVVSEHTHTNK